MARVSGGALAAVGAIALAMAPIAHYTFKAWRPAKTYAPIVLPAPSAASKAPAVAKAPAPAPTNPSDCGKKRTKDVRVVGHTMTNKVDKAAAAARGCP